MTKRTPSKEAVEIVSEFGCDQPGELTCPHCIGLAEKVDKLSSERVAEEKARQKLQREWAARTIRRLRRGEWETRDLLEQRDELLKFWTGDGEDGNGYVQLVSVEEAVALRKRAARDLQRLASQRDELLAALKRSQAKEEALRSQRDDAIIALQDAIGALRHINAMHGRVSGFDWRRADAAILHAFNYDVGVPYP